MNTKTNNIRPRLAIVMPAYNEEGCIENTSREWLKIAREHHGFVIVVNDGSKDGTGAVLDRLQAENSDFFAIHQTNAGHGAAVVNAYRAALSHDVDWVFQVDSDDQFIPEEFSRLWEHRKSYPVITGVRVQRGDSWKRALLSRLLSKIIFLRYGVSLFDSNVPFRLIRSDVLRQVMAYDIMHESIVPNIFMMIIAKAKLRCSVREVPVTHKPRQTGNDSLIGMKIIRFGLKVLRDIFQSNRQQNSQPKDLLSKSSPVR